MSRAPLRRKTLGGRGKIASLKSCLLSRGGENVEEILSSGLLFIIILFLFDCSAAASRVRQGIISK